MLMCIPDVLDLAEIKKIRAAVGETPFGDGRQTAGYRAKRVKNNLQMERTAPAAKELVNLVLGGLRRNQEFQRAFLPKSIRPPLISRYEVGMSYGLHVDDALMGSGQRARSDIALTIFLSDPADYDGGELIMSSPFGDQEVKLPAGAAVVYPSSTLHQVAPVTRGARLAAVTWAQSHVRDAAQRELLYEVYQTREKLAQIDPDGAETDLAFKAYSNLLRMWAD
ncbi:MAG TPA: Fe2+-dependent dioxygenase [Kiloniellales bacterium]|jgi:PKHD-type hydroxylase